MQLTLAFLSGLYGLASAQCGTVFDDEILALHAPYAAAELAAAAAAASGSGPVARRQELGPPIEIITNFHVISSSDPYDYYEPTQLALDRQLAVLNAAYAPARISFALEESTRTVKDEWRRLVSGSDAEYDMMKTLRRGDYATLNVYISPIAYDPVKGGTLGYATAPLWAVNKRLFTLDGVVVHPASLPGVRPGRFSGGKTLVHEVGHWLSLMHTFGNVRNSTAEDPLAGCRGVGDLIYDTPAEGSFAAGCQFGRDTCTGELEANNMFSRPGPDPIHNYMDYSDDACMNEFTPGQMRRMRDIFETYRVGYNGEGRGYYAEGRE